MPVCSGGTLQTRFGPSAPRVPPPSPTGGQGVRVPCGAPARSRGACLRAFLGLLAAGRGPHGSHWFRRRKPPDSRDRVPVNLRLPLPSITVSLRRLKHFDCKEKQALLVRAPPRDGSAGPAPGVPGGDPPALTRRRGRGAWGQGWCLDVGDRSEGVPARCRGHGGPARGAECLVDTPQGASWAGRSPSPLRCSRPLLILRRARKP